MAAIMDDPGVLVDDANVSVNGFNVKVFGLSDWKIELAFDLAANGVGSFFTLDDPTKGLLDDPTYLLAGDTFVDVTPYVRHVNTQRGRSTTLGHFTAGVCSFVLDNRDRIFDPTMVGSPFYGSIVPRKALRISRQNNYVFSGNVQDWNFGYTLEGDSTAEVSGVDGFAFIATQNVPAQTNTGELSGARVNAILTQIGWPSASRDVSAGNVLIDADVISNPTNALNYLQVIETSQAGALFVDKFGHVAFLDSADLQAYTSGLTFGDTGIPFTGMGVVYGVEELLNVSNVTFTAAGVIAGTAIATDAASQTAYGTIDETIDTLLASSADADALANWRVGTLSQPKYRIDAITISLEGCTPAQALQVLDVELGDVATVTWTPNSIGSAISQIVTVDQIEHSAAPDRHDVTFTMSETIAAFILDDAIYGVLDDDILGF